MANYIYEEILSVAPAVTKRFHDAISSSSSILKLLFGRAQAGTQAWDTMVEKTSRGADFLALPVNLVHAAGDSASRSGQYSALSVTETADGDVDFAKYNYTTARSAYQLGSRERQLMQNGDSQRINAFELNMKRCAAKIVSLLTTDLDSNTVDTDGKLIGLTFAIDSGNTVGGINQASVAAWQSYEQAINGSLTTADLNDLLAGATRDSVLYGWEQPDVLMLSQTGNSKLYSFVMDAIGANSFVPVDQDFIKYGVKGASYFGAALISNSAMASGTVLAINSGTWALAAADESFNPIAEEPTRPPGTNVIEYMWTWSGSVGLGDPARNAKGTGATG